MSQSPGRSWRGSALRLSLACDLAEVLPAIRAVRGFLAEQGLGVKELAACELALAEACNNAINYASDVAKTQPVEVEAICNTTGIELRVNDHTAGFDWPKRVALPEVESERGRGLFLIQSLMDKSEYFRGCQENLLRLRKNRLPGVEGRAAELLSPEEMSRKLTESEQIINDMAEELSSCYESLSAIFRYSAEQG